jgi:asparagine synthase (glutamine-hydrolysing)
MALTQRPCFTPSYLRVPSVTGISDRQQIFALAWDNPHPVDNSILLQSLMIQSAAADGCEVLLHGTCGDVTLLSTHHYIGALIRRGQLAEAWRECKAASDHHTYYFGHSPYEILARNLYHSLGPRVLKKAYRSLQGATTRNRWQGYLNPDFARRVGLDSPAPDTLSQSGSEKNGDRLLAQLESCQLANASTLGGANRLGGRHGVDVRDPFGDRRLVEFFAGLPEQFKVHNGWTKYLPRTTFNDKLPALVRLRRGKESLAWRLHIAAIRTDPVFVRDAMANEIPLLAPYLDLAAIHQTYRNHLAGSDGASRRLYDYITWARWLAGIGA